MNDITVREAINKKKELETSLSELLRQYETDTGLKITGLTYNVQRNQLPGCWVAIQTSITVSLEL